MRDQDGNPHSKIPHIYYSLITFFQFWGNGYYFVCVCVCVVCVVSPVCVCVCVCVCVV